MYIENCVLVQYLVYTESTSVVCTLSARYIRWAQTEFLIACQIYSTSPNVIYQDHWIS